MAPPKIDRLIACGSIRCAGYRGSNIELAIWVFTLAASMLALVYWGT